MATTASESANGLLYDSNVLGDLIESGHYANLYVGLCEHTTPIVYGNQYWNNLLAPSRTWFTLVLGQGVQWWHPITNGHTYLPTVYRPNQAFTNYISEVPVHVVQIPLTNPPVGTYLTVRGFVVVRLVQYEFRGEVSAADWDNYTYSEVCTPYNPNLAPYFFDISEAETVNILTVTFRDLCMSSPDRKASGPGLCRIQLFSLLKND